MSTEAFHKAHAALTEALLKLEMAKHLGLPGDDVFRLMRNVVVATAGNQMAFCDLILSRMSEIEQLHKSLAEVLMQVKAYIEAEARVDHP